VVTLSGCVVIGAYLYRRRKEAEALSNAPITVVTEETPLLPPTTDTAATGTATSTGTGTANSTTTATGVSASAPAAAPAEPLLRVVSIGTRPEGAPPA
jgi:hypothetical protein